MTIQLEKNSLATFTLIRVITGEETRYQAGKYRVVTHGNRVGLTEVGSDNPIVHPIFFSDWQDFTGTPYPTKQDLLDALQASIFQDESQTPVYILQNSDFQTAGSGQYFSIDASVNPVTMTLRDLPINGEWVEVYIQDNTEDVTVVTAGADTVNGGGSFVISGQQGSTYRFIYDSATANWIVQAFEAQPPNSFRPINFRKGTTYAANINLAAQTLFPFDSVEEINENNTIFESTANGVRLLEETGIYVFVMIPHINTGGNVNRLKLLCQFASDGVPVGREQGYNSYVRDSGGSIRGATFAWYYFPQWPQDAELTVLLRRIEGGVDANTAVAVAADCFLHVEAVGAQPQNPPVISTPTPGQIFNGTAGMADGVQFIANNNAAAWDLTGAPTGVTISSSGFFQWNDSVPAGSYAITVQAFNGAGASDPVSFTLELAAGIPSGVTMVVDGFSLDGQVDGSPVPNWNDESGNAFNWEQLNVIDIPTLDRDLFGAGNHAVIFNGSNQFLSCVAQTLDLAGGAPSEGELWIVYRQNAKINANVVFCMPRNTTTSASDQQFLEVGVDTIYTAGGAANFSNGSLGFKVRQGSGSDYGIVNIPGGVQLATDYFIRCYYQGGVLGIEINGIPQNTDALTGASYDGSAGNDNPTMARQSNGGSGRNAAVSKGLVAFWNRSFSPGEVTALNNYLSNRFNIPIP